MTYRAPTHVHSRPVHDELVLLDARHDAYFGLNPTGAVAWSALVAGRSPEAAAAEISAQFDVTPEVARTDVSALVDQLVARGLLEPAGA
jgi:hypothetical protein